MSKYYLGDKVKEYINTLKSRRLKRAVLDFINYTPVDYVVLYDGAFRSAELQHEKYVQGFSKCDGYKNKSNHQSGLAVDIVPWVNGVPTWDREHVQRLAGAFYVYLKMKGIKFINGGDWNDDGCLVGDSWDGCHFEVKR